ncbi:DUF262 domain-containing protein [Bacillus sp. YKCMOAS1]|uniref:DUF262 domain-containing protein n=1 Tax=Bacillus sp. YKCMOAS1 TaxID=2925778 RepID=UPI00253D042D|nr:DUF262 domain-containing protein [Bacillus sp. YKCMOAS1]GLJ04287.1 hypothetical protein OAS1_35340 [Bacillus sp. YKCMOAS1]
MIGIGSNKKIIDIYNEIKAGNLKLQPDFQRKLVWNKDHKESFIETIILGLPFPEVYTAVGEINLETRKTEVLVVDGQQRLSTIYEYINGADTITYKKIEKFKDLSPEEQKDFFYYVIVVRDLGHLPLPDIKQIFRRINSVDYALGAMEINNALYDGEYISTGKVIVDKYNLCHTFKETEVSRMKDLEFILAIMVTNDTGGYFTGYREVEDYVRNYNDYYKDREKTLRSFEKLSNIIDSLNLLEDSIWLNSRSCYFTLLVELLKVSDNISIENDSGNLSELLNEFNNKVMETREIIKEGREKYSAFYKAMYQGTSSKKNRTLRGKLLAEELKDYN